MLLRIEDLPMDDTFLVSHMYTVRGTRDSRLHTGFFNCLVQPRLIVTATAVRTLASRSGCVATLIRLLLLASQTPRVARGVVVHRQTSRHIRMAVVWGVMFTMRRA